MAYLFDTAALSELLRPKPVVKWLGTVPREEQFVSAVTVGELYYGAFRSAARDRHLKKIDERVLPAVPYGATLEGTTISSPMMVGATRS